MNGFASLKSVDRCKAILTEDLTAVPLFRGAVATGLVEGMTPDAKTGSVALPPGVYFLALSARVSWRLAERVELALVLGGDPRHRGPRAVGEAERFGLESLDLLLRISKEIHPRLSVEWDRRAVRTLTAMGLVTVPPGPPVTCEVWALADAAGEVSATFADAELIAITLSTTTAKEQAQ